MLLEGPFDLQIIDKETERELHITFKEAFQSLDIENRARQMKQHLDDLKTNYNNSGDDAEKQGMQMMIQVVSQILPLIEADEIACDETIILELGGTNPITSLISNTSIN